MTNTNNFYFFNPNFFDSDNNLNHINIRRPSSLKLFSTFTDDFRKNPFIYKLKFSLIIIKKTKKILIGDEQL